MSMFSNLLGQSKQSDANFMDDDKNPEFDRSAFAQACENRSKTAKSGGNDAQCCTNIEQLISECMRLSEVATDYHKQLVMREKEYEKFQLEKKSFDATNVIKLQSELREKNTEISYLESQLKDKDENIKKLKREMALSNESNDQTYALIDSIWGRYDTDNSGALDKLETLNFLNEFMQLKGKPTVTVDQFNSFFKKFDENGDGQIEKGEMANFVRRFIQGQSAVSSKLRQAAKDTVPPEQRIQQLEQQNEKLNFQMGILERSLREGPNTVTDLENLSFKTFNKDMKARLRFVANFHDWQMFGDKLNGDQKFYNLKNIQNLMAKRFISDGELAEEHFSSSKSELQNLMHKVYFPVVNCQEHMSKNVFETNEEFAIKMEAEKIHDTILIEIVTLAHILKLLGCEETPGGKKTFHQKISETQKSVVSGLMYRLLNQLPAFELDSEVRTDDFQLKITNFYMMLEKRLFMKRIFKDVLSIDQSKSIEDIDVVTERVANYILDYEAFCEIEEENIKKRVMGPRKVLQITKKRVQDKKRKLQQNLGLEISLSGLNMQTGNTQALGFEESPSKII